MPEDDATVTDATATETENNDTTDASTDAAPSDPYREKWEGQRKVNRDLEKKLTELREHLEKQGKTEEQIEADQKLRDAEQAVLGKANERVVRSEVKAAAAGKVKRLDLLLKVVDLSAIAVDEAGDPDPSAVEDAISAFLAEYPELAADAQKFSGSADQGAKGRAAKLAQLTQQDLDRMSPSEINAARREGRLNDLLGINRKG